MLYVFTTKVKLLMFYNVQTTNSTFVGIKYDI